MVSCSWHWKVLTLIAKWIGDKKKQEEWLRGIFVWWFVCFRYANLELRTAQQNTCKFQKMTLSGFLMFLEFQMFEGLFSEFQDIWIYRLINSSFFPNFRVKILGDLFGVNFLGWYRLFIGMWVSPSRMLARHQPDYRIPSCSPLISTKHPGCCSSTAMLSQGRQRAGRGDSRSRKFDEPWKEHKTLENIAIILHRIHVWYNYV